jgi:molecular chaperone DnaK (HSP70)
MMQPNKPIIGLDFGNFNTFPCFISDFDIGTRMGGQVRDLVPTSAETRDGIPSVYFYSERVGGVLIGESAVRNRAKPYQNRLRYLKQHLGETVILDGRTISYDDAITQVIQYVVRSANALLQKQWRMSTNLISLSYPAAYNFAQVQHLIELAERGTLEDGTGIKVFGTIAEPAAASLDYLAEFADTKKETTVLTYDLGGGTFDLGLVSVYPRGRKRKSGESYYYDVHNWRGVPDLGGKDFDEVMYELLYNKLRMTLNANEQALLKDEAEKVKVQLSESVEEIVTIQLRNEFIDIPITRKEFEDAFKAKKLIDRTIAETRSILQEHSNLKPEFILLTGGASQMPMVKEALEREFPEYRRKIISYRPSRAIAYGAARFGTKERDEGTKLGRDDKGIIALRIPNDIGIGFTRNSNDPHAPVDYISTYAKAGTELPFDGQYRSSTTRYLNQTKSSFLVFESKSNNPGAERMEDWKEIMRVEITRDIDIERGETIPKGTESETRIRIDKGARVYVEARDVTNPNNLVHNTVQLVI